MKTTHLGVDGGITRCIDYRLLATTPRVISKYIFDIFSQSCFDTSVVLFATHLS